MKFHLDFCRFAWWWHKRWPTDVTSNDVIFRDAGQPVRVHLANSTFSKGLHYSLAILTRFNKTKTRDHSEDDERAREDPNSISGAIHGTAIPAVQKKICAAVVCSHTLDGFSEGMGCVYSVYETRLSPLFQSGNETQSGCDGTDAVVTSTTVMSLKSPGTIYAARKLKSKKEFEEIYRSSSIFNIPAGNGGVVATSAE